MQRTVQIYIKDVDGDFQRIDLFKDESISITDKIQDVRDIAKVFTEFSQSFSVPASKTNNKLFKHYYNADIVDGFDARKRVDAKIEINNIPFKEGKVVLQGVNMMNNSPESYRITFFGNTIKLKDILGDDELGDLNFHDSLNFTYDSSSVKSRLIADPSLTITGTTTSTTTNRLIDSSADFITDGVSFGSLVTNTTDKTFSKVTSVLNSTTIVLEDDIFVSGEEYTISNDIIAPLITHSQRLFFDSGDNTQNTGNISNHNFGGGNKHGVRWDNIKYAIRLDRIIKQIEYKYSEITFSNDFFTSSNVHYYDLFMWMHRNKGYIERDKSTETISGWSFPNEQEVSKMANDSTLEITLDPVFVTDADLILTRSTTDAYDVSILRNGEEVVNRTDITSLSFSVDFDDYIENQADQFQAKITSNNNISFTSVEWNVNYQFPSDPGEPPDTGEDSHSISYSFSSSFKFDVNAQMPKMKVMDFLDGLFKMFNLTAFVESDGTIYVDTLDEFYVDKKSSESPYEIDKYVDSTKHQVDSALPYKNVKFTYEDLGTLLAIQHEQIILDGGGNKWGEEDYVRTFQSNQVFSGDTYEVKVPFCHMKFERLLDLDDNSQTDLQWGYSADDNFNQDTGDYDAYIGKPLLFYPVNISLDADNHVSFITAIDPSDNSFDSHDQITTNINIPSNSRVLSVTANDDTKRNIHFKNERNEYTNTLDFTYTLFDRYYSTYITQVFTKSNRIIKLKAFLPLKILLNYTLADKFIYKGRKHQINSITTNITTGESEIELLNIVIE